MIKADFLFKNINQKQIIAKNFFWLSFSQISGRVLKAILIILAARILGASEYGRFSLSLSILSLFFVFAGSKKFRVKIVAKKFPGIRIVPLCKFVVWQYCSFKPPGPG